MNQCTKHTLLEQPYTDEQWDTYRQSVKKHFNEDKMLQSNQNLSGFNTETYPDIHTTEESIKKVIESIEELRKIIAVNGNVSEDSIRLEEREKEPFGFKASSVTIQQLKKNQSVITIKLSELKSGGWIDCIELQQFNTQLLKHRELLERQQRIHMVEACSEISDAGKYIWTLMEQWVSHIDCTQCIAHISMERGYVCPTILDTDSKEDTGSSFSIKQIRHPLVESLSSRVSYVKHDVSLNGNDIKGWLVYGMNASGKSTLMKATGISILLAQAGCFVPATEMTLKPFKSIYTRILNNDNLFAGLSSFAVEMSELRDILRNATQYTLVLGDELCSGTESISAQALVASGIQWMTKRNAKFIFATHLHDLPTIIDTKAEGVEVLHLHVEYDPLTKKLIYDRTLRPGSGSSLYGLEVARAMDLPFEFIEQALVNRHKLVGSSSQQDAKSSSWNKSIIRKSCEVCKTDIVSELEVHHIKPRESAKNGILEDGTHMNDSRNLIVLCEKCHDEHHAGKLEIGNVVITSDGESRMIQNPVQQQQKQQTKSRKWTDEEIEIVKNIIVKYSSLSLKSIKSHLQAKFGINISESMLSHFKKNNTF
jgi:DNA mismatch repair ATPase MutS